MKKELNLSLIILSSLLVLVGFYFSGISMMVWGLVIAFCSNLLFSVTRLRKNVIFFFFNITFFIFLLGRIFVTFFLGYNPLDSMLGLDFYDVEIVKNVVLMLFLSLQSLFIGYYVTKKMTITFTWKWTKKLDEVDRAIDTLKPEVKKISFVLLLVTFVFRLSQIIDIFLFVEEFGYNAYYVSFQSSLPFFVRFLAGFFSISFFTYIATLPRKKELYLPITLYFIEGLFSLGTGQRNMFALNILIIIIYLIYRMNKDINLLKLNKKIYIVLGVSLLLIAFIFILIGNVRWGISNSNQGFIAKIARLLFDQGVSVNLLGYSISLADYIPSNKFYSFSPFIRLFKDVLSIFIDIPTYSGQTVDNALYGDAFTYTITYLIMPFEYIAGRGYGSTYIAELFIDFSYKGIIMGNLFYGLLMNILARGYHKNFVVRSFSLLMIRYFLFTPRAGFLDFITYVFSPYNLLFMFVLVVGCSIYSKNKERA